MTTSPANQPSARVCVLTGASGFVGRRLKLHLEQAGWQVVGWSRTPPPGEPSVPFALGEELQPSRFTGVRALVHCAYDFEPRAWKDITAVNVAGSQKLLAAARRAQVESVVFISSLSAFEGCRSLYGHAKLEIEAEARAGGAFILRPGLIYGPGPGGMFGRLVEQVEKSRIIPVLAGGRQTQYLAHETDLASLVLGCLEGRIPAGTGPIAVAHEQGWELRALLRRLAELLSRRVSFIPVPWQLAWTGLRFLEALGVKTQFRSDSLLSLVYQDPHPDFSLQARLGFPCRPFELTELTRRGLF